MLASYIYGIAIHLLRPKMIHIYHLNIFGGTILYNDHTVSFQTHHLVLEVYNCSILNKSLALLFSDSLLFIAILWCIAILWYHLQFANLVSQSLDQFLLQIIGSWCDCQINSSVQLNDLHYNLGQDLAIKYKKSFSFYYAYDNCRTLLATNKL